MGEDKRTRQRRKRAEKRKQRVRERARQAQAESRFWQSYELIREAREFLERGNAAEALRLAGRAAGLRHDDPLIGGVFLEAAERMRDPEAQAHALEYVTRFAEPDTRLFAQLAYLYHQRGDHERARAAVGRARAALPARMKGRKQWLSLIEYVEAGAAAAESAAANARKPEGKGRRVARPEAAGSSARKQGAKRRAADGLHVSDARTGSNAVASGVAKRRRGRHSEPLAAGDTGDGARSRSKDAPIRRARGAATTGPDDPADPALSGSDPREPTVPARLMIPLDVDTAIGGLEILAHTAFADPEAVALAALAARIRDAESYDRLLALERAHGLTRFSHQEDTARKVLSTFLGRALLADEVGLGKTIEAGLILSEYLLRGQVERALVLAPPSLVDQWREELSSKFDIDARTTEGSAFRADPDGFWSGPGVVIASLATARSPRQRDGITGSPWDLVVVDEAHALKNAKTASYGVVSRLTSRFLLLLTATPVENRIEELYNLVSLIRPGHLGGRSAFLKRFSDSKVRRSKAARAEVRSLLGEVMVRNTRALSGVRLPPRFARTVLVTPDPAEAELYGHLVAALRAIGASGRTRLLLSVLLQEAGSSPLAVHATLEKMRANPDVSETVAEALAPAIRCAARPIVTGKAAALRRVLDGATEPAVVFTRFRATLEFLADVLARAGMNHETIDGNVPAPRRHDAIGRLRRNGGVLLSTEVGAEGLNLQFCRRIVNFDLPWNPMRIEQRIGRVHRIGQDHPVDVINLCLAGSIEERILTILDERINLFELVVGEVEMILGYLDDEREFSELVFDAFADPDEVRRERSFTRIADALAAARTRYDNVKSFDERFFRDELGA